MSACVIPSMARAADKPASFSGQSYRLKEDTSFSDATGLRNEASDYVGAIQIAPNDNLVAVHRFRINQNDFKFSRNEFDVLARTGPLTTIARLRLFRRRPGRDHSYGRP